MADLLIDNEVLPSTPAASKSILFCDSTSKKFGQLDDSGNVHGILSASFSGSGVASQTTAASDTYITSSGIVIPALGFQVGQLFRWYINLFKATNAGTATPIYTIRLGNAQSTGDTSLLVLTGIAQTAVTGGGTVIVTVQVRTIGASGVIVGNFSAPGVVLGVGQISTGVSGSFNTAGTTGQFLGISVNSGASTTYTIDSVRGELIA